MKPIRSSKSSASERSSSASTWPQTDVMICLMSSCRTSPPSSSGVARREPLARDEVVLGARDGGEHLVALDPRLVGAGQVALEHALGVALVVDRVARRAARVARVGAQDARAQRVEGAERDGARELGADAAGEPLAHLAGRLVGERDRQDLAGVGDALLDQVRGALGHHARLAGARAGDHEQRAVGAQHGLALLGVERLEARRGRRRVRVGQRVERRARGRRRAPVGPGGHGARRPGACVWDMRVLSGVGPRRAVARRGFVGPGWG